MNATVPEMIPRLEAMPGRAVSPFYPDRPPRAKRGRKSWIGTGQSLVEFALILPVLMLLIFGIIEFGRALYDYNAITNAAREAAHYGAILPNDTPGIQNQAINYAVALDLTASNVTVTCDPACISGFPIHVTVNYTFQTSIPGIIPTLSSLTLQSEATEYIE